MRHFKGRGVFMNFEREFLGDMNNDYGISRRMISKIDKIVTSILVDYGIELEEEEYLSLLEQCCMNVSSSNSKDASICRKQSINEAIVNTMILFSKENNWMVEVLPIVKKKSLSN